MKYGIIFLVGGLAAFASLRRFLKPSHDRRPTVGAVSDRWLLSQRGDDR
jgi:hypothetical protein